MRIPRRPAPDADPQPFLASLPDDHARAQALAAQQPTERLGPIDTAWLSEHLAACPACQALTVAYESDRLLLRGLRDQSPRPPRDLWARTSAALDGEIARTNRNRRASPPPRGPGPYRGLPSGSYRRPAWRQALLSGLLMVALVVASSLINGLAPVLRPDASDRGSGPGATPIAVLADVSWIQTSSDGSYDVYQARIDQVCPPADPSACRPINDPARGSITLGSRPQSVSYSPNSSQLVVVSSNTKSGGSVIVVTVPDRSSGGVPSATPFVSASPRPTDSVVAKTPGATVTPVLQTGAPTGQSASPAASVASPLPTLSTGTAISIAEDVIVVGGNAAHSPDGSWFAFAARPADGSTGPDIYVWRVGDSLAHAITSDHRSVFSGWLGGRIIGSRIDESPLSTGAQATETPKASGNGPLASARPSTEPGASAVPSRSVQPEPSGIRPGGTDSPGSTPLAAATPVGGVSRVAGASPTGGASQGAQATSTPAPSKSAGNLAELGVTSFLLDPVTGEVRDIPGMRFLRPVVDPTSRWVVYWEGTVLPDAGGLDWGPATGRLVVAPWTLGTDGASSAAAAAPAASATPAASAAPAASGQAVGPAAGSSPSIGSLAASATPAAPSPSATQETSRPPSPSTGSGRASADPSANPSPALQPTGPQGLVNGPVVDFDAQFDPGGTHLAIWTANAVDPGIGSLSLYVLDAGTWRLDPQGRLVGVQALRGFAIGEGQLAWVSPPAGGQGSRIEVLGWTADGFGSVKSVPGESLLVIH